MSEQEAEQEPTGEYNPMTSERRVREILNELQEADLTSKYNKMDASQAYGIIYRLWKEPNDSYTAKQVLEARIDELKQLEANHDELGEAYGNDIDDRITELEQARKTLGAKNDE